MNGMKGLVKSGMVVRGDGERAGEEEEEEEGDDYGTDSNRIRRGRRHNNKRVEIAERVGDANAVVKSTLAAAREPRRGGGKQNQHEEELEELQYLEKEGSVVWTVGLRVG